MLCKYVPFESISRCGFSMLNSWEAVTVSEAETILLGQAIGKILRPGDAVLLQGDLGSGKTRLAKGIVSIAARVAIDEVVSPTYTLINRFEGEFPVYHADLYRIESNQVDEIGLEEPLGSGGALIVEWAEKILDLGGESLRVFIYYTEEEDLRKVVFEWTDKSAWATRLPSVIDEWERRNPSVGATNFVMEQ